MYSNLNIVLCMVLVVGGKLSKADKKALAKQAKKDQKQANAMIIEAKEDGKSVRERLRQEEEAKRQASRDEKAILKAEEERIRLEEEKKKEEEMYDEWKDLISVETEGTGEGDAAVESQGLLGEFIEYIKNNKVCALEDLASEFGMRTQDVINRIKALEQTGALTGVMDDRGKYIWIGEDEMNKIVAFIEKKGRITISKSNLCFFFVALFLDVFPCTPPI